MHVETGYSSRLDEVQAAMLRVKLARLPGWNEARRRLAARYDAGLRGLDLTLPVERPPAHHVYHQYCVRTGKRAGLAVALADVGIGTSIHYPTILPSQPLFSVPDAERRFPRAAQAAAEVLGLPCFPEMTDDEIAAVIAGVRGALAHLT
jgi:dTDP-4-amino-4,6-dideoxygalactose transaminase